MKRIGFIFLVCLILNACTVNEVPTTLIEIERAVRTDEEVLIVQPTATKPPAIVIEVERSIVTEEEPPAEEPAAGTLYLHSHDLGTVWQLVLNEEKLTRFSPDNLDVSVFDIWLGDGRYAFGTKQGEIFVALPGQEPQLLYSAAEWEQHKPFVYSLDWSPDGSRLAYTMLATELLNDSIYENETNKFDGLSLLSLAGERTPLITNRYCHYVLLSPGGDLGECYRLSNAVWSPDGTKLLVRRGHWEWVELYTLDLTDPEPEMKPVYHVTGMWLHGSWTRDSQGVLLSNQSHAMYSPLVRVDLNGELDVLIDKKVRYASQAYELPEGIAFFDSLDDNLYIGQQIAGEFTFDLVYHDTWCDGYKKFIWNSTGDTAVMSCQKDGFPMTLQLVFLNGSTHNLKLLLEPLGPINYLEVIWGS